MAILFRSAFYREAGTSGLAALILSYLWDWIHRAGLTKEQVLGWLQSLLPCPIDGKSGARHAGVIPSELVDAVARLLVTQQWNCGDLAFELSKALDDPPPGYRWRADKSGHHYLKKVRSEISERAIVRGKRFADHIFIGIWWKTNLPKGRANQSLQRFIRAQGGSVFWREKTPEGRQYGAFVIVDQTGVDVANTLCRLVRDVDLEDTSPGREDINRLSAISMNGIAEGRSVKDSDRVHIGCIRSIKFNWEHSLPDLLNGRIVEFRHSKPYQLLIQKLRER